MGTAPQSDRNTVTAEPTTRAVQICEQLSRLVGHPLFTNSKRYPVLLTYVVEQTLLGHASELKERTIGVEAFGRETDYDVNLDPIVRTTAAEVRKRLSQYYYSPDHAGELTIELPVGSYIPIFREPGFPTRGFAAERSPEGGEASEAHAIVQVSSEPTTDHSRLRRAARGRILIPISLLATALIGFGAGHINFGDHPQVASDQSNLARFWSPITSTTSRITYCLGVPTDAVDLQSRTIPPIPAGESGTLNVYDVITLARAIAPLVPKNGEFRVLAAPDAGFAELREGPSVMIGAFDNPWVMRITQDLPIGFEYDNHARKVVDRKSTPKNIWMLQWQVPGKSVARDYAVVARLHDKVTGEPVIILGGILGEGTEAASEAVSNSTYLDALVEKAPKNWDQLNLEAVVEANVIDGHPGPPTIVAVETW